MMLPGENFTRDRAIFFVTFRFRAPLPRPTDWAGDSTGPSPGFESGVTTATLTILADSPDAARDFIIRHRGKDKDFELVGVEVSPVQLDFSLPSPVWGGRL